MPYLIDYSIDTLVRILDNCFMKPDHEWRTVVDHTRRQALQVIRDIRAGGVDELDLDRLSSFVQFSLALMQMEGRKRWALAKVNAEIMSLHRGEKE